MSPSPSRHLVDPKLSALLDMWPTMTISAETLPAMRERQLPIPVDPAIADRLSVTSRTVPGPEGAPDVAIFIYRPKAATGVLPCIFHIHGGGYVGGSPASMEGLIAPSVDELGCALITVEYRLAPETRFPGAVEDCYAALAWVMAHTAELQLDPARIGVMGESAGGGLAAALALLVRDRGEYRFAFQTLIYPMIDDRTVVHPDPHPYVGEFIWTAESNRFGWASLLGVEPGSPGVSPYAAAARAEDLTGLPSAFISTGSLDLFLEEDLEYARRLMRAGVPVELHVYPGGFHAFDVMPLADISVAAQRDKMAFLKRSLFPAIA